MPNCSDRINQAHFEAWTIMIDVRAVKGKSIRVQFSLYRNHPRSIGGRGVQVACGVM